jgi:hypothetical protein
MSFWTSGICCPKYEARIGGTSFLEAKRPSLSGLPYDARDVFDFFCLGPPR